MNLLALLGMPTVCLVAALAPAVRAHRLSAARTISAGSAPRAGRALGVQRRLAGSRLPRSVNPGLGLPFARPGRSALTLAAVVLGVTTVTFATGLATTMDRFGNAGRDAYQVTVYVGKFANGKETKPTHDDLALHSLLRSLPDAREVTARADTEAAWWVRRRSCGSKHAEATGPGWTACSPRAGGSGTPGRSWPDRPSCAGTGWASATTSVWRRAIAGANLVVVGEFMESNARVVVADWSTMRSLAPQEKPIAYHVKLRDGADQHAYARAAEAADPGLSTSPTGSDSVTRTIIGSATALTLLLAAVASLGVFNTVVLNTRDRRRDLGMLKSIGMTPRQVTEMTVASMALLGALGSLLGIPLGVAGHQLVVPRRADAVDIPLPSYMTDVCGTPPALAGLALAGLVIAVLGAYLPARRAARLTVAEVYASRTPYNAPPWQLDARSTCTAVATGEPDGVGSAVPELAGDPACWLSDALRPLSRRCRAPLRRLDRARGAAFGVAPGRPPHPERPGRTGRSAHARRRDSAGRPDAYVRAALNLLGTEAAATRPGCLTSGRALPCAGRA